MLKKFLSIRFTFLIFGAALMLVQSGFFYYHRVVVAEKNATSETIVQTTEKLTRLSTAIHFFFQNGNREQAESLVSQMMSTPTVKWVLMSNEADTVIFSSRYESKGKHLQAIFPDFTGKVAQSKFTGKAETLVTQNGTTLLAAYPIILGFDKGSLRPNKIGSLLMEIDLASASRVIRRAALLEFVQITSAMAICTVFVWVLVSRLIRVRIGPLVAASMKMADGDYTTRSGVEGTDELGQIGRAFDHMAELVQARNNELKGSEERLKLRVEEQTASLRDAMELNQRILSVSTLGIAAYGPDGECIFANEAMGTILNVLHQDLLNTTIDSIPDSKESSLSYLANQATSSAERQTGEIRIKIDGTHLLWLDVHFIPFTRNGQPHLLFMANDVTNRIMAEMEILAMRDQLDVQEKMATIGQITATVSHELRNPLGTISASIFRMRNFITDPERKEFQILDRIERNVNRCNNIINDLLDFSRNTTPYPESTEIDAWIGEQLRELNHPDWLQVDYRPGCQGLKMELDRDRMRRALINLVENGTEAMEEEWKANRDKECRLTVSTQLESGQLAIVVSDTGPGMPQHVLDRIFEPLFSTKTYGVGLGLPTVRQIMEQQGGSIEIKSLPGSGTQSMLWLPLAEELRIAT